MGNFLGYWVVLSRCLPFFLAIPSLYQYALRQLLTYYFLWLIHTDCLPMHKKKKKNSLCDD